MKDFSQVAKQYTLDETNFYHYLIRENPKGFKHSPLLDSFEIDADITAIVYAYKQDLAGKTVKTAEEKERLEAKQAALANILITSGFNFEGYRIIKYSGYISGDDAINVDRGLALFGAGENISDKLMKSLVVIRRNALAELKESAFALGCNAVIGVDFDYLTLDPQTANILGGTTYAPYVFGVTANGNAVVIEKIPE